MPEASVVSDPTVVYVPPTFRCRVTVQPPFATSLVAGELGLSGLNAPLWSRSWYTRPVIVWSQVCVLRVGNELGGAKVFASGFEPESLKSFDCFTTALMAVGPAIVAFVEIGTWKVTVPVLDGRLSPRNETTLLALLLMLAPAAAPPLKVGVPSVNPSVPFGKVTSPEPSDAVFDVFVNVNFTEPYAVFVQRFCASVVPATGADGLLTAPLDGNRTV